MASESYHEPLELLSEETKNLHRGIVSLIEELEAVDWYLQRAEACSDAELKEVLVHNRNEEMEHASMVLEWIRRRSGDFDVFLREYLFTTDPIAEKEAETEKEKSATPVSARMAEPVQSLGIGSFRGKD